MELMENPKITVIIPVYNSEKYLGESINSVLNQNLKEFELIIVNDGSTDRSLEIAEGFKRDLRVKVISQENKGRAGALNSAINKGIKGEYALFLDSDDLLTKGSLVSLKEVLDKNEETDIVYGDMEKFWPDGTKEIRETVEFASPDEPSETMKHNQNRKDIGEIPPNLLYNPKPEEGKTIPSSGTLIRRTIFDSGIRFDESLKRAEDNDFFFFSIGHRFKLKKLNKVVLHYRIHEGQKSKDKDKMLIATKKINDKLKKGEYFN